MVASIWEGSGCHLISEKYIDSFTFSYVLLYLSKEPGFKRRVKSSRYVHSSAVLGQFRSYIKA